MFYYLLGVFALYLITLAYFFLPSPYLSGSKFAKKNQSVAILVLGDIGRSPRMQYHALSLSKAGFKVELIGYRGTQPHKSLLEDQNIKYQFVPEVPDLLINQPRWLFPLFGPLKALHQVIFLFIILGYAIDPPAYLLVQNPPSIPSLFLAQVMCYLRNSRLVIDWHNLGYSILALKLGSRHPMVLISKLYEQIIGKSAYAHLTVTDSMQSFIREHFNATGTIQTLHDRPPSQFQSLSSAERVSFLKNLQETQDFRPETDKLLVSSTSWTADEDFQILLDALVAYDSEAISKPKLLVIITGKGPMKEYYQDMMGKISMKSVAIRCAWLSAEDYPKLLAASDIGISLHTSSSGMDLPMKVVDMFGCSTPVLAVTFPCIHELISEGTNGRTFADAEDLAQCLVGLFAQDEGKEHLRTLKDGAMKEGERRWDDEWNKIAKPLFSKRE